MAGRYTHAALEEFVTATLSKREPCPAMVLAWGWLLKMGEGGVLHNGTFKQRYFVLARVPHATVLIYYAQKCMDEDHILGYIDLRKVTSVRETTKIVALDMTRSPAAALMSRLKGFMSPKEPQQEGTPRPVIELVTSTRTYVLAPATIVMPPPMTTSMALGPAATGKPLYLFGWPFPVPPMDDDDDEATVAEGIAEGRYSTDSFEQWRDVLATAVAAEKATRVFPVTTLVDSSAQLPQRVLLRTTPCELAVISIDDKDMCFTAIPYNDLLKWEMQVDTELHVTARTRARLVARPDRTGFTSQRPTRPTCHFVFKSPAAKAMVTVVDNHLRALAKQLGQAEAYAAAAGGDDGGEEEVDMRGAEEEVAAASREETAEDERAAKKKMFGKRPAPAAAAANSDDEGGGSEEERPAPAAAKPKSGAAAAVAAKQAAKKAAAAAEDDDDEDDKPAAKAAVKRTASNGSAGKAAAAAKKASSDDEEDEDDKPKAKAAAPAKKAAAKKDDSDDEEEEDKPKAKAAPAKKAAAKKESDDEDEEDAPKPAAKKAAAKKKDDDSGDDDDEPAPIKKKAAPKKKADSDSD